MQRIFGYCRISTSQQNIDRQERNIIKSYPEAKIYKETFTGTKTVGRKEFEKILKQVQSGDIIVFDSVSRMSRNYDDGVELYMSLMDKGVDLVFLKEPQINTQTYKKALNNHLDLVGNEIADIFIKATNEVLRVLATEQIKIAFNQSQKEVDDLHQRTREGIETARRLGKQIGQKKGAVLHIKKSDIAKQKIKMYSKSFHGTLNDLECIKLIGISRNTYYKYKKELLEEKLLT